MIIQFIIVVCAIINILVLMKNTQNGIFLFLLFSTIMPIFRIFGLTLSYELLTFAPIFLIYIIKDKLYINILSVTFLFTIIVALIMTLISIIFRDVQSIGYFVILGSIRGFFILCLCQMFIERGGDIGKYFKIVGALSFLACIYQFTSKVEAIHIFHFLYSNNTVTVLDSYLANNYMERPVGLFDTPVKLGAYSLLMFGYFYSKAQFESENQKNELMWSFVAAVTGVLAFSKSSFVGIPITILACLILKLLIKPISIKINIKKLLIVSFVIIAVFFTISALLEAFRMTWAFNYYLSYLKKPLEILATRYSSDTGILKETFEVIKSSWYFGVGYVRLGDEFVGDSTYVTQLLRGGIISLIALIIALLIVGILNFYQKNYANVILLLVIIIIAFGMPVFNNIFMLLIIAKISSNLRVVSTAKFLQYNGK